MTWAVVAVASAGATLIGGVVGSTVSAGAAKQAAKTQSESARKAQDTQERMFMQSRADQEPYRLAGYGALGRLSELSGRPLSYRDWDDNPYAWDPSPLAFTPPTVETLVEDPGYKFRVAEGQKALERSGSAKGLTLSGGQLKALTRFGQDMGSQEYGAAYDRALGQNELSYGRAYQGNQERYGRGRDAYTLGYNTLLGLRGTEWNENANLAGLGQTAVVQLGQLGDRTGGRLADLQTGAGNARAAGIVGAANAWNQGLGSIAGAGNTFAQYQLLSSLMSQNQQRQNTGLYQYNDLYARQGP